jgi:hypothetical protein
MHSLKRALANPRSVGTCEFTSAPCTRPGSINDVRLYLVLRRIHVGAVRRALLQMMGGLLHPAVGFTKNSRATSFLCNHGQTWNFGENRHCFNFYCYTWAHFHANRQPHRRISNGSCDSRWSLLGVPYQRRRLTRVFFLPLIFFGWL